MKYYNDRIRELREDNDLKQKNIAEFLGIKQQVYSTYEIGDRALPIEHLIKLCRYYDVSADWVLGLKATK
jgi:transcriptional regulator with XRE-family HTH domain